MSDSEESCDGDGKYSVFMAITSVDSNDDLKTLKEELGEHTDVETIDDGDASKEEEEYVYKGNKKMQESYKALLEESGDYAKIAKAAIRKMKKVEEYYNSVLVRYKEAKVENESLKEELNIAYSKIKFLELEVVQSNAKV